MKNKDNSDENEFNKIGEIGSSKISEVSLIEEVKLVVVNFFFVNRVYKCGGGAITQYPPS